MKDEFTTLRILMDDDMAVVRIHPPPSNRISALLMEEMRQAFMEVHENPRAKGIVLTGTGSDFISGMSISWTRGLDSRSACMEQILPGHRLIRLIERGPKPVVAAINGNCSRGALEIALGCHYRIGIRGARLGMLDARFGLIPMLGGTQRLPRLVEIGKALDMITQARDISADEAGKVGLIDEVVSAGDLMESSGSAIRRFLSDRPDFRTCITSARLDKLPSEEEKQAVIADCRERLDRAAKGYIAPRKALEAVEKGLSLDFEADIAREAELFCDCALSRDSKNLIALYLNTRNAGAFHGIHGGPAPRKIRTVGILGCGEMGLGIAAHLLERGVEVRLWEDHEEGLRKGMDAVHRLFGRAPRNRRVDIGQVEAFVRNRLKGSTSLENLDGADMAIDTRTDPVSAKRERFRRLEAACREHTLLAICGSAVSLAPVASVLDRPHHLVGLRFFKPPDRIQLLEIGRQAVTPDEVLASLLHFAHKIRKIPVVTRDGPGGFTFRQILTLVSEFGFLVSEGVNPFSIDRAVTEFGLPLGIARMCDILGMDEVVGASRYLGRRLGDEWPMPPLFEDLFATGGYGRKTGSGWYDYGADVPTLNFEYLQVVKARLKAFGTPSASMTEAEILERLMLRSLNEGVRMMEEGVSDRVGDMDMAMVYGVGFPPYRGGIFRYADSKGLFDIHEKLVKLAAEKGPRFQPAETVREMARSGLTFYSD